MTSIKNFIKSPYVSDVAHVVIWVLAFTIHAFPVVGTMTVAGILSALVAYFGN